MHFTAAFSLLALGASSMVSATPTTHPHLKRAVNETSNANCVNGLLCCPQLKTPLDPILDPLLGALGIDASSLLGSVGLLCMLFYFFFFIFVTYTNQILGDPAGASSCSSTQLTCCTEANLLGGTVALGCEPVS